MLPRSGLIVAFVPVVFVLAASAVARADEYSSFFPRGTWSMTGYGAYSKNFTGEHAALTSGTVGGGYFIFDNVSLNAELSGWHNEQHGPDADITAADILLRQHLLHWHRFSFFVDVGGAVSYADHRTPQNGTYFNFMEETGLGGTFRLWDNVHLIGGIRYFHLSNAHLEGPLRNPSINAMQGYLGVMIVL